MKTNKKELTVFALCAYAIPFLMMPLLYICLQNGQDTSIFANAQMFYPAAGVMLAFLLARRPDTPKRFYSLHIVSAVLMLVMSVLSVAMPQTGWLTIANVAIIIASVLGWILLLTEKKERREAYGLRLHGKFLTALAICVYFLAVKTGMVFLSVAMQGGDTWANYLAYWRSPTPWIMAMALIPNFFLSFLPFFGEEYGWRCYLTPALQNRFGARRGALAVGVRLVASAAEPVLLQPGNNLAEYRVAACCLYDAWRVFHIRLRKMRQKHLGVHTAALFEQ